MDHYQTKDLAPDRLKPEYGHSSAGIPVQPVDRVQIKKPLAAGAEEVRISILSFGPHVSHGMGWIWHLYGQVAGRSSGQIPHATPHENMFYTQ
jgi:hypothetical protein